MMTSQYALAETDPLLSANPATAQVGSPYYLVESVSPETAEAIDDFAEQWAISRENKVDQDKVSDATNTHKSYARLFDDHIIGRVHFYERSHNWNGENEDDKYYNYVMYPGAHNKGSHAYTNSYGFNVLRSMADTMRTAMYELESSALEGDDFKQAVKERLTSIMENTQQTVYNDELRYYINQTVWYTTKQVVKETK